MEHDEHPKPVQVTDGRFAAVVHMYLASTNFRDDKSSGTQELWGRELRLAAHPDGLGSVSVDEIRPRLIQAFLDGISDRPSKQNSALTALKQLEKWAIVRDLLPRQITLGVEAKKRKGGHIPWTQEQVELAERHARPDLSRAVTLQANTGQRGSDLVRMGWGDIETYDGVKGIGVKQRKTGREVWIPITSTLAAAMATWERKPGPILTKADGSAWGSRKDLGAAWALHRTNNRALEELWYLGPNHDQPARMHGLRGYACVQLLRAGANTRQISDMVGMSEPMVANYTRFSLQKANAVAAVIHLEKTIQERARKSASKLAG